MRFHFLLTNHYPYGVYKIEDHIRLIAGGLAALGHKVTYGFDDDVAPWPSVNLLVEFFNFSPVVDQVIRLKRSAARYAFGLVCYADVQDATVMEDPNFPDRRPSLTRLMPHMDFVWTVVPCDYSGFPGADKVRFLEYGYVPSLRRPDRLARERDVLIYGGVGPRRTELFNALVQRGLSVSMTTGILPGYFKHDLLDRARVVVDVRRTETVRFLSPARQCTVLHSGATIVAEKFDTSPLAKLYGYGAAVPFNQVVDMCVAVARAKECQEIGRVARDSFARETSMATNLQRVMDDPVFQDAGRA